MTLIIRKLRRRLSNLWSDRSGNTAVIFALALVPMVGLVGAAVDYSHASSIKTAMQAAADATALAMSKTAGSLTSAQMQTTADAYFKALLNRPEAKNVAVTTTYNTSGGTSVTVAATASMPTNFMGVMGFQNLPINATGQAAWGMSRLRVALVLDNTGSMASAGKIEALKTATNKLLSQLKSAATNNGDVYVSIIPFVKDVNVDSVNYTQSWIDWTNWDANNGSCSKGGVTTQSSCLAQNGNPKWTPDNHNSWNGCVVDRGNSNGPSIQNYDTNVVAPSTSISATLFSAEQYAYCPAAAVMALNYDWSAMTTLVNSMTPNGNTNQAIGLQLGWMSLVGGGPFPTPPAMDPHYQYSQVIILLTDGLNTEDRWYTNQSQIDARQQLTCDNVNAAGVTLYTIQVNTDGDPTSALLQNCAGSPGKYPDSSKFFLLTSANQIVSTFQTIGTNLSQLRISK